MRAAFLVLLLWAVACAHPVPDHEPARRGTQQEDAASEDYINELGNLLGGGDGRSPPASAERGDNALAGDSAGGNAVGEELGEHGGPDKEDGVGEAQHLNRVDHEATSARDGNSLGFLEEDARDADDGDNGEHRGTGVNGLPSHAGGLLDEEDESGDDTFDENGEEEGGEGPTYVAGADRAGERGHDAGRGDVGAGGRHGDSSSSSSSESIGADHRCQEEEEESYDFEDEAMQGDDPSVFDSPGSSYKGRRAGPRALGSSRESGRGVGSHRWEEDDSRSPEEEDADSGEDSPSTEDNSQSEEPTTSQSEEDSASRSEEDEDEEDSPSREDTADQSDEEPGESPEDISRQSGEDEGDQSKSEEDDGDQSQSTEDTLEESKEDENDSNPDGDPAADYDDNDCQDGY
ncbi:PREDICTED: dentin matrix acidic phosphoprotein 1 [Cariama cristata]|uniref:dentin matrix acidic phosphoprotein 1 n=1 Tax=Cariama cristata TaxID=54380 RepID=UPI000520CD1A|nr:PREDICTED: dentin matrix acidic phosphoprotein 1 [Cariama cristata]